MGLENSISKGEFDRRVKLIEEKLKYSSGNFLQQKYNEFVERLNTIVTDNADFNRYASIVNRIYSCFDTDTGQFDGSNIKPLTIDTAAISVGQRSQQLSLRNVKFVVDNYGDVNSQTSQENNPRTNYGVLKIVDDDGNQTSGTTGYLVHYTLFDAINADESISATVATFEIDINSSHNIQINTASFYYIYVLLPCIMQGGTYIYDSDNRAASIEISTSQIKIDQNYESTNCLYVLLGTISKELVDSNSDLNHKYYRIVDLNYGLTTINGRLITTGRIEGSVQNGAYFDLDKGEIGGKITFRNTTTNTDDDINDIVTGSTEIAGGMISNNLILLKPIQYFIKNYDATKHYGIKIGNTYTPIEIHEINGVGLYPGVYEENETLVYGLTLYREDNQSVAVEAVVDSGIVSGGISGSKYQAYPAIWAGGTTGAASMVKDTRNKWRDSNWDHYSSSDTTVYDALLRLKSYLPSVFIDFDGVSRFGNVWLYGDSVNFESAFDLSGSNISGVLPVSKGGTNNTSFTQNYLTFCTTYNSENKIASASGLSTNGSYLHILNDDDVEGGTAPTNAPFTIGTLTSQHIEIDNNEILSKSNGTTPSTLYLQDGNGYVQVSGNGLGVCGSNTSYKLYVNGTSYLYGNTSVSGVLYASTGIWSSGYVSALGQNTSDKRLKKDIEDFNGLELINKFDFKKFKWNKKANKISESLKENSTSYGVIAQNSDNIIDDFVFDLPNGKDYKGVRYEKLIPIMAQAIKDLNNKIIELEKYIAKHEL